MKRPSLLVALLVVAGCRSQFPGASLSGRVVVRGQSALAGITVSAVGPQTATTETNAEGRYAIDNLVDGTYVISAVAPATVEASATDEVVAAGPVTVPDLTLTPAGRLHGRATKGGAATGNSGILVSLGGSGAVAATSDEGEYHLDLVPVGSYTLRAVTDGFLPASVSRQRVEWNGDTTIPEMDLVVIPNRGALSLRGTALLYGQTNHAGTRVTLVGTGLTALTAADGSWQIAGVAEGSYALQFANGDYQESVPEVLALAGSTGLVLDGSPYPLSQSPLTLYRPRRIASVQGGSGSLGLAISTDGRRALYIEPAASTLWVAAIDGSGTILVADEPVDGAAITPDGLTVAYVTNKRLQVVPTRGGPSTLLATGVFSVDNLISPDGKSIAYIATSPTTGLAQLVVNAIGGGAAKVLPGQFYDGLRWSGDGTRLFYRTAGVWPSDTATVNLYTIATDTSVTIATSAHAPVLSHDGRRAIVVGNYYENGETYNGTLLGIDLTTGTVTTLASGVYDASFVGDDRVVYRSVNGADNGTTRLSWVSIAGGASTQYTTDDNWYVVSTDQSTLLYSACANGGCSLYVRPPFSGSPMRLADGASSIGLSGDGSEVLYRTTQEDVGPWRLISSSGGAGLEIDARIDEWYFSVDDSHFLYAGWDDADRAFRLTALSIADGTSTLLGAYLQFPVMAPDLRHLALTSQPPGARVALSVVALDGSPAKPLYDLAISQQWTKSSVLVGTRFGVLAPYRFQNGIYAYDPASR